MTIEPFSYEYNIFLILTIVLLAIKLCLSIYLGKLVQKRIKEIGSFSPDFIFGFFVFMVCLFVSRLFYMYFDFVLTLFDPNVYYLMPNIIFWKLGAFTSAMGYIVVLFIVDKKVLKFKLKGIPAYFSLVISFLTLLWPVNNAQDFQLVSALGFLIGLTGLIIFFIFIYSAIKIPGLRSASLLIAFGLVIYAVGAGLVSEAILAPLRLIYGPQIQVILYFIYMIMKITGLLVITKGVINFKL